MRLAVVPSARNLYALHRWVSLVVLLQLLLWATSGLVFAFIPARSITSAIADAAHEERLITDRWLAPEIVLSHVPSDHRSTVYRMELRRSGDRDVWIVRASGGWVGRYDATSGAEEPLGPDDAARIATEDQDGRPSAHEVVRYDEAPPLEYRGRPLPAYRVVLDDEESTAVWIDARTGDVTARRTDRWRIYDFFWSLHIMDYTGREDIHHPLLVFAAALAELTALTGLLLWLRRMPRKRQTPMETPP